MGERPGAAPRQAAAHHSEITSRRSYVMSGKSLAGRKALVTGGARGIGAAIAQALAEPAHRS